jgi:cytochrome c peroxidase
MGMGGRQRRKMMMAAALAVAGLSVLTATGIAHAIHKAPPRIVVATVGTPFRLQFDAKDSRAGAKLGPEFNGLRMEKGVISGVPAKPMVMYAVAEPANGKTGVDTTWIVAFASDLSSPSLPAQKYGYVGGSKPVPMIVRFGTAGRNLEAEAAAANPTTDAGATLGRVLFYDRRLSANDGIACASCHLQSHGFGDTARVSRGINGQTKRHSMSLTNVRFTLTGGFFWDQRAPTLEQQVLMPIQDSIEMGMTLANLTRKLEATDYYPALFNSAFGTPEITPQRTANALAQFLRSLVSTDSPFDRATTQPGGPAVGSRLTPLQRDGLALFNRSGCALCHVTGAQTVFKAMNSGLDSIPADSGAGRAMFRPPSLRNIAVRPPYMHDGRFSSLDEVIDFYSSKVNHTPNLDVRLRDRGGAKRLQLTAEDREALLAFLNSLTDSTFLAAPEFSNPFTSKR